MLKFLTTIFLVFFCAVCGQVSTKITNDVNSNKLTESTPAQEKFEDCITMNFHYFITNNFMATPKVRDMEVFLDEKAFSKENLKLLFSYLSKKYPEPNYVVVKVKTNWAQFQLPSDCPPEGASNQPSSEDKFDYHQAIYYRKGEFEYFNYNPILKTPDFDTVVIKGSDNKQ